MAYGTANGISNNIKNYAQMITGGDITTDMVAEFRTKADAEIDAKLVVVIPVASLPLTAPTDKINSISDDIATFFILRRQFTGTDKNESAWVQGFWDRAMENLEWVIENPGSLDGAIDVVPDSGISSSTTSLDPVFGFERTINGTRATNEYEESMENW